MWIEVNVIWYHDEEEILGHQRNSKVCFDANAPTKIFFWYGSRNKYAKRNKNKFRSQSKFEFSGPKMVQVEINVHRIESLYHP